jgi:hypothetical protein
MLLDVQSQTRLIYYSSLGPALRPYGDLSHLIIVTAAFVDLIFAARAPRVTFRGCR